MTNCPSCGSGDVEIVPGRRGDRGRAPRTIICYADGCRAINELHPTSDGRDRKWVEVTG